MKRSEKIQKRKERANKRKEARNKSYRDRVNLVRQEDNWCNLLPLSSAKKYGNSWLIISGAWEDSSSPTGYTQKCSYFGTCEYPCNGDC